MKISTKTGDHGTTGLIGGARVTKDAPRIEAYGTVDELNAALGIVRSLSQDPKLDPWWKTIQADLFVLGAELATSPHPPLSRGGRGQVLSAPLAPSKGVRGDSVPALSPQVTGSHIKQLERWIEELETVLPPLRHFVLPRGAAAAAYLHLARGVCRRAERRVVSLGKARRGGPSTEFIPSEVEGLRAGSGAKGVHQTALVYLNRLSDLLFLMARWINHQAHVREEEWHPRD